MYEKSGDLNDPEWSLVYVDIDAWEWTSIYHFIQSRIVSMTKDYKGTLAQMKDFERPKDWCSVSRRRMMIYDAS